jgi:DNA (cytosine-5)-methyltransferase 1
VISLDRASFNQGKNAQFDFEVSDKGINSPLVAKGPSAVCYSIDQGDGKSACNVTEGKTPTLICTHGGEPAVCYTYDARGNGDGVIANTITGGHQSSISDYTALVMEPVTEGRKTLNCMADSMKIEIANRTQYTVRRLTPLECERLQGYPDGWTDIGDWTDSNGKVRKTSDAARYKALGNSIALPPWKWVIKRLCACYERDATMASLFGGIGGFPYIWEQINGKGSCLWASEIEEFPIAVTKERINKQ